MSRSYSYKFLFFPCDRMDPNDIRRDIANQCEVNSDLVLTIPIPSRNLEIARAKARRVCDTLSKVSDVRYDYITI